MKPRIEDSKFKTQFSRKNENSYGTKILESNNLELTNFISCSGKKDSKRIVFEVSLNVFHFFRILATIEH